MSFRGARTWALALPSLALLFGALAMPASATTIHAGDSLYVTVWNHPELSKTIVVDADGMVRVPMSGVISVGGLDEATAAHKIENGLRPYIKYPAVNVETTIQGTTLFVAGGPVGVLKYMPGETLAAAIADEMQQAAAAGGGAAQQLNADGQSTSKTTDANFAVRSRMDLHDVKIERDNAVFGQYDTIALSAQGNAGPVLEPGDRIVFKYKPIQVHVMGDVAQPGIAYLDANQSITEAVAQAGGVLPTASANHVLLKRGDETHSLAFGDPLFQQPAQPGDIILVPTAPRVTVTGRVLTPGLVSLRSDNTLLSAIYTAGGPIAFADLRYVKVIHGDQTSQYNMVALTHGDTSQNPVLADGDTVLVPRNNAIDFTPFMNVLGGIAAGLTNRVVF